MRGGFDTTLLDEIRSRVDIVELVGQQVNLRRAGANWKGLCPFHQEKTPSFTVHPQKGIFHCFGCGAGGDAFSFLQRQERLTFPEAVRTLAGLAGVALPEERPAETDGRLDLLRRLMSLAAESFGQALWSTGGERARQYLEARGIDGEVARRFGLGWAAEGWDNLQRFVRGHAGALGLAGPGPGGRGTALEEALTQVGLVLPRQTGPGFYDRFRGRLIFPIRDAQGRVVAFGGRALGPEEPKYLNSPETSLYSKGQVLYALDLARAAMRERRRAVVVEGYVDCLMAHQHGVTETVAALGTAFTPAQLALLRRQVDEVITVFDADAAGKKASARAEEMLEGLLDIQGVGWSIGQAGTFGQAGYFALKVATLPAGHDPDSLLRAEGASAFRSRLDQARSILSFVLAQALEDEDLGTQRGRATAHARAALILSKVTNAEEATALAREAGLALGVDPTQLWIETRSLAGARARQAPASRRGEPAAPGWPPPSLAERDLVALLVHVDEARRALLPLVHEEDISHPGLRLIVAALRQAPAAPADALLGALAGEAERGLLAGLLLEERTWPEVKGLLAELARRYEIRRGKARIREVARAIAEAQARGDHPLPALETELAALLQQARAVREISLAPAGAPPPGAPPAPAETAEP